MTTKTTKKSSKTTKTLPGVLKNESKEEQETIIGFTRGDENIEIYTSDNVMWNKLKKLITNNPEIYKLIDVQNIGGEPASVTVTAPMRCLSLRAGKKRDLTDEQREELSTRMKKLSATAKKGDE